MRAGGWERLTFLLAALLLFSIVTTASAVSQSWYLTDDTTGVPFPTNYFMDKGSGAGDVSMGTYVYYFWAANEPAAETCDMSGTWKTHIEFSGITGEESVEVQAAVGVLSGGTCYWKSTLEDFMILTSEDNIYDVDLDTSDYEIELDEYLIFGVQQSIGGSGDEKIVVTNGESYISSPGTDPGYPVPELSSLVLFSVGLLAFAGYVWVSRRK